MANLIIRNNDNHDADNLHLNSDASLDGQNTELQSRLVIASGVEAVNFDDNENYITASDSNANQLNSIGILNTSGNEPIAMTSNIIITGTPGNDVLVGDSEVSEIFYGYSGNDILDGGRYGSESDRFYGGAGNDEINGGNYSYVGGGTGNDIIFAGLYSKVNGNSGNDRITAEYSAINGGAGNDYIVAGYYSKVDGGTGSDTIIASSTSVVNAGSGNDIALFYTGLDFSNYTWNGGNGTDTLKIMRSFSVEEFNIDLLSGELRATGESKSVTSGIISFENVIGSDSVNSRDIISGNDGTNTLSGLAGNDVINGRGGNDILNGGEGADRLNGGSGVDTASYEDSNDGVIVFTSGRAGIGGEAQGDEFISIENIIGSAQQDQIVLNADTAVDNTVNAGDGDDRIRERDGGSNTFNGEGGEDRLFGGAGNDIFDGGDDSDLLFGGAGNDTLNGGIGDFRDELFGNADNDTINGGGGDDRLRGETGEDSINGGTGNDNIRGGVANDILFGDEGDDTILGDQGMIPSTVGRVMTVCLVAITRTRLSSQRITTLTAFSTFRPTVMM